MRKTRALLIVVFACVGVLAVVTITNVSEWHIVGVRPPVVKYWNSSLYPLVNGSWRDVGGLNVTYYGLLFVPGWQEDYVVGRVANTSRAVAHFEKLSEAGGGTYDIYLGSQLELSNSQASGSDVSLPASLRWSSTASNRYSVLAWLVFRSGATARQMVNFTAQPMSRLYTASRTCSVRSFSDDFSGACARVQYSFDTSIPSNKTFVYTEHGKPGEVGVDQKEGNPPPSLYTESHNGYASFFIDYSSSPFSASAPFAFQYHLSASLQDTDYLEVNFFIDTNGDGSPDLEVIYYGSGGGTNPYPMALVIYGVSLPIVSRPAPGFTNSQIGWHNVSISQVYTTGVVVGVAFTAYSPSGVAKIWWDNVDLQRCALPSHIGAVTSGGSVTMVYIDDVISPSSAPSVATEVDARCGGAASECYGLSAAVYDVKARLGSPVAASGFSFNVSGLYMRNSTDVRNNVAYVSVAIDTDNDGSVNMEYIYYRDDTLDGAFITPLFSSTTTVYKYRLGPMSSGNSYAWSGSLPRDQQGSVLYIALAAVDASGNADGTTDDFWVFWDDLSLSYYVCDPLPSGWSSSGDVVYRSLVDGGVSYAANFTGEHPYGFYFFDGGLNPVFGVNVTSAGSYMVVCGASRYTLSVSGVCWADLRPLTGVYEAILRDSSGTILARYMCSPPGSVSYIG
ncbi:MAG: hypothetical protein LM573_05930, partial [Thermofilum sp.]|nr:hypothetical protein [Thermofilum sp.]